MRRGIPWGMVDDDDVGEDEGWIWLPPEELRALQRQKNGVYIHNYLTDS